MTGNVHLTGEYVKEKERKYTLLFSLRCVMLSVIAIISLTYPIRETHGGRLTDTLTMMLVFARAVRKSLGSAKCCVTMT